MPDRKFALDHSYCTKDFGDTGRGIDADPLAAPLFATENLHPLAGDGKCAGQKPDQVLIGLAVHRRCGNTDFNRVSVRADDFVAAGTWLYMDIQDEFIALPVNAALHGRHSEHTHQRPVDVWNGQQQQVQYDQRNQG